MSALNKPGGNWGNVAHPLPATAAPASSRTHAFQPWPQTKTSLPEGSLMNWPMRNHPHWTSTRPQLPASMAPTASYGELYPGSSLVPICLRNLSAHNGDLRRVCSWPIEGMDPGSIESPGPRGVVWSRTSTGQEAATQMGAPICPQWLGPGQDILDQATDQVDRSDTLQGALMIYTPHMYDDVKANLQEMQDIGAIRKLHSWSSMVVLVWIKDWSLRFCTDLRKLNNQTIKDTYLLSHNDETLNSLQGLQWFSSLNLKSAYWQVKMDEESKPLTAFTIGLLGFLPGQSNALWINQCSCNLSAVNEDLPGGFKLQLVHHLFRWYCHFFFKKKDLASHLERLEAMLQKLEQAGLKFKPSKCGLFWLADYLPRAYHFCPRNSHQWEQNRSHQWNGLPWWM